MDSKDLKKYEDIYPIFRKNQKPIILECLYALKGI